MGKQIRRYAKAIAGFLAPGAVLIVANGGQPTSDEWWVIGATCIVSAGAVAVTGPRGGRVDS